jgi:hypothetical protein
VTLRKSSSRIDRKRDGAQSKNACAPWGSNNNNEGINMTKKKQTVKSDDSETQQQLAITVRPAELFKQATDVASVCKEIVTKTAISIKGRKYVKVEGWEAIAAAHGFVAGARDVERIDTGWKAIGELRRISDGTLIATAEGFVGDDEPMWSGNEGRAGRAEYAIRAMAQTRAISRVCRSAFAHVVVLISEDLSTTPAEEMPFDAPHSPTRPYEEEKIATPKAVDDRLELSVWLKENNIPEGFVLAMLKEKKLVSSQLQLLGNAPPGVIRRTLQSRERLLVAFQNSSAGISNIEPKPQGKSYQLGVQNEEGDASMDQSRSDLRQPVNAGTDAFDYIEQEGYSDWREVAIHWGKQKGEKLGTISNKSLSWWIGKWHPTQYNGRWSDGDLLLDAALCVAHAEMSSAEKGAE